MLETRLLHTATWLARKGARPFWGASAKDLSQDALLAAWRARERYDVTRGVSWHTYARHIMRGAVGETRRRMSRRGEVCELPLITAPVLGAPDTYQDVFLMRQIRRAVNRLPWRQRYVILRRYWHGEPQAVVARRLGVSPSRVCQIERQARRHLGVLLRRVRDDTPWH